LISHQSYNALDLILHRLAFLNWSLQFTAADIEKAIFGGRFRHITVERPVFIASLPRAGTTLLLELLSHLPELATHRYRDMPFVMAPLLWETLSRRFRKTADPKERAHGDGMQVSYDSPEAFEEVIWRAFWPEKFEGDTIELWSDHDVNDGFQAFFLEHMQRIIALRSEDDGRRVRYASKNNANIARLGLLRCMFPDSVIVVPFRDPVDQAESIRRQHLRFLEIQRRDVFSKNYMRDIGHFEFGKLHQPFNFGSLAELLGGAESTVLDYWIGYWLAAYSHIVRYRGSVVFVSYERLCEAGVPALRSLEERLDLVHDSLVEAAVDFLRPPNRYECDIDALDTSKLKQANRLHDELLTLSTI